MTEAATSRWAPTTMDLAAVAALGDELLDWRYKGMPPDRPPVRLDELGAQGWDALGGDLPLPVMLLSETALQANVDAHGGLLPRARRPARPARQDDDGAAAVRAPDRGRLLGDDGGDAVAAAGLPALRRAADPLRQPAARAERRTLAGR